MLAYISWTLRGLCFLETGPAERGVAAAPGKIAISIREFSPSPSPQSEFVDFAASPDSLLQKL